MLFRRSVKRYLSNYEADELYHQLVLKWEKDFPANMPTLESIHRKLKVQPMSKASLEEVRPILATIPDSRNPGDDNRDESFHPSYTTVDMPYYFKCRARYAKCRTKYEKQFQLELSKLIHNAPTANEQMSLFCNMTYTTLWPPLHNAKEIEESHKMLTMRPEKVRKRILYLLNNKVQ